MRGNKKNLDPLFELFELYLMTRSYDDAEAFTRQLAQDYLTYLDSTPAHIPIHLRNSVLEDLEMESHELLVKKMYGCVKTHDYSNYGKVMEVRDSMQYYELAIEKTTTAAKE